MLLERFPILGLSSSMTPDHHVTIAIILGSLLAVFLIVLLWLRWCDTRRIK